MTLKPLVLACSFLAISPAILAQTSAPTSNPPTTAEAELFVQNAEKKLEEAGINAQRAEWVYENFITDDTEAITAQNAEQLLTISGELALQAKRFNGVPVSEASARKLAQMQLTLLLTDPKERAAYAKIAAYMAGSYGKAKYCFKKDDPKSCLPLGELEKIMATSRDPAKLKETWLGWHSQSPLYKEDYAKYVALSNKGAQQMGFADTGALWRSNYEMTPEQFEVETERLWQQVKPLYDSLYTYTRHQLQKTYGVKEVPSTGPIPAHLFGNMWSQTWDNLYPILKPAGLSSSYDLSKVLEQKKVNAKQMTAYAERFYTSLGMEKLPDTFWQRSLLTKPKDREVVCHASAWDIDTMTDVRIKMCITPTAEDFTTIHHELGHVYYFLAYRNLDPMFRNGANDGFHEAIGDTVALSVTPEYLKKIGLRDSLPTKEQEIGTLLNKALEKVAFLPFGYLVDKWRWEVYSGKVKPADYDKAWWALREKYQGISRPAPMEANGFDAGAKFHVASDTPYARYFLADILQFQFHRALCKEAGFKGQLNRCSIFENKAAGQKFQQMLAMGSSKPWVDALKVVGEDKLDASAILDYFAPLKVWLDEQNAAFEKGVKK